MSANERVHALEAERAALRHEVGAAQRKARSLRRRNGRLLDLLTAIAAVSEAAPRSSVAGCAVVLDSIAEQARAALADARAAVAEARKHT